jgi:hypothetical protein
VGVGIKRNIFGALSNKSADDKKPIHAAFAVEHESKEQRVNCIWPRNWPCHGVTAKPQISQKMERLSDYQRVALVRLECGRKANRFLLASRKKYL